MSKPPDPTILPPYANISMMIVYPGTGQIKIERTISATAAREIMRLLLEEREIMTEEARK